MPLPSPALLHLLTLPFPSWRRRNTQRSPLPLLLRHLIHLQRRREIDRQVIDIVVLLRQLALLFFNLLVLGVELGREVVDLGQQAGGDALLFLVFGPELARQALRLLGLGFLARVVFMEGGELGL